MFAEHPGDGRSKRELPGSVVTERAQRHTRVLIKSRST